MLIGGVDAQLICLVVQCTVMRIKSCDPVAVIPSAKKDMRRLLVSVAVLEHNVTGGENIAVESLCSIAAAI